MSVEVTGRRFLRLADVMKETGLSRTSIYEGMAAGSFPKSFNITQRAIAWWETDVDLWKLAKLQRTAA
jgi:prophage regulatory protein